MKDPRTPPPTGAGGSTTAMAGEPSRPAVAAAFVPAPGGLRLLTAAQLRNSVRDLLGEVTLPELEADTAHSGFASVGAGLLSVSPIAVERYEGAAREAARQVFADARRRAALVTCAPKATVDDVCARTFLAAFLRRAWRRPPPSGDVDRYVALAGKVAATESDFHAGLRAAVAAALQSPFFLYRAELGEEAAGGRSPFSGHEMASRLSYLLWNTTPDDELLAGAPALTDANEVRRQATRLLASPRARDGLVTFATELFAVEHLASVAKDAKAFPTLTSTLREAMAVELRMMFANHALEKNADMLGLFTTPTTFVDAELAKHYGLPPVSGSAAVPVTLPASGPRAGVLGTGAFLTMWGKQHETSPTLRGKFIRTALLCQTVPSPPPGVPTVLPDPPPGAKVSRRQLLTKHVEDPSCAGCHGLMDPIGFGLEAFDGIGRFRRTEHDLPIDPSGALDGAPFADARGLAERLRAHPGARDCFVRNVYRYATGHVETPGEELVIAALVGGWTAGGHRLRDLVLALVTSDGFRFATPTRRGAP